MSVFFSFSFAKGASFFRMSVKSVCSRAEKLRPYDKISVGGEVFFYLFIDLFFDPYLNTVFKNSSA